jgi:hypothetical protein
MRPRYLAGTVPGHLATALAVATTTALAWIGASSLFYETWGTPLPGLLLPLLPAAACLTLCWIALHRPLAGGAMLLAAGALFATWWLSRQAGRGVPQLQLAFGVVVIAGPVLLTGLLFLVDSSHRRSVHATGARQPARRHRDLLVVGVPLLVLVGVSAVHVPRLAARLDDGFRGARLIEGNGVTLVWAPRGPGWNAKTADGAHLSWNAIAGHEATSAGRRHGTAADLARGSVCAFLDESGTTRLETPQYLWRMPTANEIVRSLTRGGENAGCAWDEISPRAVCRSAPDKETPLWAPDERPIYYLAADEFDSDRALAVSYSGGIGRQSKSERDAGGFRCVKRPPPPESVGPAG